MRVLIGCGGTGGHIYPALAIADSLRGTSIECLFVGAQDSMEAYLVPAAGYTIKLIPIKGLKRKQLFANLRLPWLIAKSLYQVKKIIHTFKPDVVIGTGGYTTFPTLLIACCLGIPTLIHEQNSTPGLVHRLLARYISKICTGYAAVSFPGNKHKIHITGNPIHSLAQLPPCTRTEARLHFKLSPTQPCLLVIGGSGGANTLNNLFLTGISDLQRACISLLWITGRRYYAAIQESLSHYPTTHNIACYPFLMQIGMAYHAADVVVARAGALSIAELCVAQKPTIFVPSPNVVDNHQYKNVIPLAEQLAAIVLAERDCPRLLMPHILQLVQDLKQQQALINRMSPFAKYHKEATIEVVKEIISLGTRSTNQEKIIKT